MKVGKLFTGREGINYIATEVNNMNYIWREQPIVDIGIDGEIEIVDEKGSPTGKYVKVQSKSGKSYFQNETQDHFTYRVDKEHVLYWKTNSLPVIIVVYHPTEKKGYWVDVQQYLSINPISSTKKTYPFVIPKSQIFCIDCKTELENIAFNRLRRDMKKPPELFFHSAYPIQENFTGRIEELNLLTNWVYSSDTKPFFLYHAFGGNGKSSLVWTWLINTFEKQSSDYKAGIWWSFYESAATFQNFLEYVLPIVSFHKKSIKDFTSKKGEVSYTDCRRYIEQELKRNRFLLVLDGLERTLVAYRGKSKSYDEIELDTLPSEQRECIDSQLSEFLKTLANPVMKTKTLATSRLVPKVVEDLAGFEYKNLEDLDPEDAFKFMKAQGVVGPDEEIKEVCKSYGYYALALRMLSKHLLSHPINPGHVSLAPRIDPYADKKNKLIRVFDEVYETFDERVKRFLSILSAIRKTIDMDIMDFFSKWNSKNELYDVIKELIDRDLLMRYIDKETGKASYGFHPHVKNYLYNRIEDKENVHELIAHYYSTSPVPSKPKSISDLAPLIELYHHTVGAGKYDEAWILFWERLHNSLYYQMGVYPTIIELMNAIPYNKKIECLNWKAKTILQ